MAIIFNKQPSTYISSDSPILMTITDTDPFSDQRISVNSMFDEQVIDSIILDSVALPFSRIDFTFEHNFKVGERVVVYHTTTPTQKSYNGEYLVTKSVNDSSSNEFYIVIDLIITEPFTLNDAIVSKTIKTSSDLNPASMDLSPVLKNKVSSSIQSSEFPYTGESNVWKHKYFVGREYTPQYNITGIVFETGNVSFLLDTNDDNINIGDEIFIEIDDKLWEYDDNFFDSNKLSFDSTNDHKLRVGIPIFVNGQITEPSYNGRHIVDDILSATSIRTTSTFTTSTPAEGGTIIYQAYPEWNRKRVIVQGKSTFGGNTTIITNLLWYQNDANVTGKITKLGDKVKTINDLTTTPRYLYNSSFDYLNYSIDQMDDYVIKQPSIALEIDYTDNNISTTRNLPTERDVYSLIPKEGDEHVLIHTPGGTTDQSVSIDFLDKDKSLLSTIEYSLLSNVISQYFPVSIKSLLVNSGTVISGDPLSVIEDNVYFYKVRVNGSFNRAVYFPNDVGTQSRQLITPNTFPMPTNNLDTQWSMYMLMDLTEVMNLSTSTNHAVTLDDLIISLSWNSVNGNFDQVVVYNDGNSTQYNINIDTLFTDSNDGSLFLLYVERDQNLGDLRVGLTNRSYDDFPTELTKEVGATYGGRMSLGNTYLSGTTPFGFIGTIYWMNIYSTLGKKQLTDFNNAFGGVGNWQGFDPNNTDQQTDLYSWFDFDEGELYSNSQFADNEPRYDSLSQPFTLITLNDVSKYGTPAVEDTVTESSISNLLSNELLYRVDKRCERYQNPIYLSFIDSLGALTSIAFKMKNKSFIESSKSSYYKQPLVDQTIPTGGDTVYHTKSRRSWTLTTDIFTEQINANLFFEDLMKSNEQYIRIDNETQYIPVTVDTDSLEIMDSDDGVWTYTFDVIEKIDNHRY